MATKNQIWIYGDGRKTFVIGLKSNLNILPEPERYINPHYVHEVIETLRKKSGVSLGLSMFGGVEAFKKYHERVQLLEIIDLKDPLRTDRSELVRAILKPSRDLEVELIEGTFPGVEEAIARFERGCLGLSVPVRLNEEPEGDSLKGKKGWKRLGGQGIYQ